MCYANASNIYYIIILYVYILYYNIMYMMKVDDKSAQ